MSGRTWRAEARRGGAGAVRGAGSVPSFSLHATVRRTTVSTKSPQFPRHAREVFPCSRARPRNAVVSITGSEKPILDARIEPGAPPPLLLVAKASPLGLRNLLRATSRRGCSKKSARSHDGQGRDDPSVRGGTGSARARAGKWRSGHGRVECGRGSARARFGGDER